MLRPLYGIKQSSTSNFNVDPKRLIIFMSFLLYLLSMSMNIHDSLGEYILDVANSKYNSRKIPTTF